MQYEFELLEELVDEAFEMEHPCNDELHRHIANEKKRIIGVFELMVNHPPPADNLKAFVQVHWEQLGDPRKGPATTYPY